MEYSVQRVQKEFLEKVRNTSTAPRLSFWEKLRSLGWERRNRDQSREGNSEADATAEISHDEYRQLTEEYTRMTTQFY